MRMTEDDHEEFLRRIDVDDPIMYYQEFFVGRTVASCRRSKTFCNW